MSRDGRDAVRPTTTMQGLMCVLHRHHPVHPAQPTPGPMHTWQVKTTVLVPGTRSSRGYVETVLYARAATAAEDIISEGAFRA